MKLGRNILLRMFGRPEGALGRLGGLIMARGNRVAAETVIALLKLRANDRVLEIGFGPGVAEALLAAGFTDVGIAQGEAFLCATASKPSRGPRVGR